MAADERLHPVQDSRNRPTDVRQRRAPGSARLLLFSAGVAAASAALPADDLPLEVIVVTATKREEQLQRVPQAISALSGKTLEAIGAVLVHWRHERTGDSEDLILASN